MHEIQNFAAQLCLITNDYILFINYIRHRTHKGDLKYCAPNLLIIWRWDETGQWIQKCVLICVTRLKTRSSNFNHCRGTRQRKNRFIFMQIGYSYASTLLKWYPAIAIFNLICDNFDNFAEIIIHILIDISNNNVIVKTILPQNGTVSLLCRRQCLIAFPMLFHDSQLTSILSWLYGTKDRCSPIFIVIIISKLMAQNNRRVIAFWQIKLTAFNHTVCKWCRSSTEHVQKRR